MKINCRIIYVSFNRQNLRFFVKKVKKDVQLKELKWFVNLIKDKRISCLKIIIFCNIMNEIVVVVNYLILELGKLVFYLEYFFV